MTEEDFLGLDLSGPNPKFKDETTEGIGHNSLVSVVEKAKTALARIQRGEGITWEGWRDYGVALNEGKSVFKDDDKGFGQWIVSEGLDKLPNSNLLIEKSVVWEERAAAMWIASSPEEEQQALLLFPNARTPRGLHAKWKDRPKEKPDEKTKETISRLKDKVNDSATTEPERQAIQKKLDKFEKQGIDINFKTEEEKEQTEEEEHQEVVDKAQYLTDNILGNPTQIRACLIYLAKNAKQLDELIKEIL